MNFRTLVIASLLVLLTHLAAAGPVAQSQAWYTQPDGTSFSVNILVGLSGT